MHDVCAMAWAIIEMAAMLEQFCGEGATADMQEGEDFCNKVKMVVADDIQHACAFTRVHCA